MQPTRYVCPIVTISNQCKFIPHFLSRLIMDSYVDIEQAQVQYCKPAGQIELSERELVEEIQRYVGWIFQSHIVLLRPSLSFTPLTVGI